ncbi:MAG: ATP-binding cassette domain-containing protein [Magnetococcales bacterium]|nr:ATP-binding cassette domain-containing protein [Magnetococcales bacterium]
MKEIFHFLAMRPFLATGLVVLSFLVNLLGLASSLYVMQVLNRYIGGGVDATLITLTLGVILAVIGELGLRRLRRNLAYGITNQPMGQLAAGFFSTLLNVKLAELLRLPTANQRELLNHFSTAQKTYIPANVLAMLDVPFALLFVGALLLIHPLLAVIASVFLGIVFLISLVHQRRIAVPTQSVGQLAARHSTLSFSAVSAAESIRAFNWSAVMRQRWWEQLVRLHRDQANLSNRQENIQALNHGLGTLMGVAIICTGAKLSITGQMDTGQLIGANIIAGRAMAPLLKFAQMVPQLAKAKHGLKMLEQFSRFPLEKQEGSNLQKFNGHVELQGIGFAWPGTKGPIFDSLSVVAEPGKLLAVVGSNGTGKTTLLRLLAGVLEPQRGKIFVDGYNQSQILPEWWRRQLTYLPQEPLFLDATLRDNLVTERLDIDDTTLNAIVDRTDLRRFVNESEKGLDLMLTEGGQRLSPGIRRRIALTRALVTNGSLVLLDEPLEGLDVEGRKIFLKLIQSLVNQGYTVIVASHDASMAKVADTIIDLNYKPIPKVTAGHSSSEVATI